MSVRAPIPNPIRSLLAFVSAIGIVVTLSIASDAILSGFGAFSAGGAVATDVAFLIAALYRAIYSVLGGYIVAMLAPRRAMMHAWILGGLGTIVGIAGVAAYFTQGGTGLGPLWYAISIPASALPCCLLGAKIRLV